MCGPDNRDCEAADKLVWQAIIDAAEAADDKSAACEFTAFAGYEFTRSTNAMHLHRNTIFRNAHVPDKRRRCSITAVCMISCSPIMRLLAVKGIEACDDFDTA